MPNINIVVVTAKMIFLLENIKNLIKKVSILLDNEKYKHLKLAIWGVLGVDVRGNVQLNIILTFKFWQE